MQEKKNRLELLGGRKNVLKVLKQVIAEVMSMELDSVELSASFVDDLGCDPLDIVHLLMALEETFDIEISDEEANKNKTVEDILNYITDLLAKQATSSTF